MPQPSIGPTSRVCSDGSAVDLMLGQHRRQLSNVRIALRRCGYMLGYACHSRFTGWGHGWALFSSYVASTLNKYHWKILYCLKIVSLTCSKSKAYKPINFVSECHYMSNSVPTNEIFRVVAAWLENIVWEISWEMVERFRECVQVIRKRHPSVY